MVKKEFNKRLYMDSIEGGNGKVMFNVEELWKDIKEDIPWWKKILIKGLLNMVDEIINYLIKKYVEK